MERRFAGHVALVTGAGSGIGAASARRLAGEGAHVVVVDVDPQRAEDVAGAIDGIALAFDVADARAWDAIAAMEPSVAHLNAGVGTPGVDLGAFPDELYRTICGVNIDGVVWGIRAVVPGMRRRGGGAIVVTASVAGLVAYGGDPFYSMTKHALVGLVRAASVRLARDGITIDALCPDLVSTPMAEPLIRKRRLTEPDLAVLRADDVAAVVADALADDGSGRALVCRAGHELHVAEPTHFD